MALKNWTKTGRDEWHKFLKGKSGKFYDGIFITPTRDGDFLVDSFYGGMRKILLSKRRHKTKSQALKFAKKYMRSH